MMDAMTSHLLLIRTAWLAGIPCGELCDAAQTEMFRTLALSEYGRLNCSMWKPAITQIKQAVSIEIV